MDSILNPVTIRSAARGDAGAVFEIYAPYVTNTCVSFETEIPSVNEISLRIENTLKSYPYLVCEMGGKIVGYAYASKHRERAAYRYSADVSVYVAPEYHRQGIGRELYSQLFLSLEMYEVYTLFAGIALPNEKSVGLHKAVGFREVGVYHRVGHKFGKWIDVMWLEKQIKDYDKPMDG